MINGRLRDLPLADVFQILANGRKSGVLTLVRDVFRARIYFELGRVQYAHLTPGVHLGEILVRMDLLTAREVQELLLRQSSENAGTPLGLSAVEAGYLEPEDLRAALERQVVEVLAELLGWREGSFTFTERSLEASQVPTGHTLDAMALLMRVAQQRAGYVDGAIAPDTIYRRASDPTRSTLPEGAWEVLGLLDGRRSAAGVAAESDLPEQSVFQILHRLEVLGIVQPAPYVVEEPLVLVVSGSSAMQRLLRLTLQRARFRPHLAMDFEAGLDCLHELYPHAIVVDDEGGNGWRFVRQVRRLPGQGHLPIVVLTQQEDATGLLDRFRRPRAHALEKPFHELEFQQLLGRLVGHPLA